MGKPTQWRIQMQFSRLLSVKTLPKELDTWPWLTKKLVHIPVHKKVADVRTANVDLLTLPYNNCSRTFYPLVHWQKVKWKCWGSTFGTLSGGQYLTFCPPEKYGSKSTTSIPDVFLWKSSPLPIFPYPRSRWRPTLANDATSGTRLPSWDKSQTMP